MGKKIIKLKQRKLICPICSSVLKKTNVKHVYSCPLCNDDFRKEGNTLQCLCNCNTKHKIAS